MDPAAKAWTRRQKDEMDRMLILMLAEKQARALSFA
jgi:hypothetical protein